MLKVEDVVSHLFRADQFARFAGMRSRAMLDSPLYQQLDEAHGRALSALDSSQTQSEVPVGGAVPMHPPAEAAPAAPYRDPLHEPVDTDPSDEVMTGAGDTLTLLFALFVDGVQLHGHGRDTTTVIGLKCLDLPAFLCHTDLACYALAFIGGPKEPSDLSEIMSIILDQFKCHEPSTQIDREGK